MSPAHGNVGNMGGSLHLKLSHAMAPTFRRVLISGFERSRCQLWPSIAAHAVITVAM